VDSFGIGARLKQQRLSLGRTVEDVSRETRISRRFLEAIEMDDFERLPGLIFTRNFVRQYALSVNLDPDPLLAELPTQDESTVLLPDPPAGSRPSFGGDRRIRSAISLTIWLAVGAGAIVGAWLHFNHSHPPHVVSAPVTGQSIKPARPVETPRAAPAAPVPPPAIAASVQPGNVQTGPVRVVVAAQQRAWIQMSVDGKNAFTGTLVPGETKEMSGNEEVKLLTGNAGALTISLNGKTLDSLGRVGEVRAVTLTAEGPRFPPPKAPPPAPDPL